MRLRKLWFGLALFSMWAYPLLASAQGWEKDLYSIGERRRLAEYKVAELKTSVKDSAQLKTLEQKYMAAMAKHGAWLDIVATAVMQKQKKLDTPDYRQIVDDAAKAFVAFDSSANDVLYPKPPSGIRMASVAPGLIGEIIGQLIQGGIAFWKAKKELEDAERKAAVEFLTGRAQWPPWNKIEGCSRSTAR